MKPKDPLSLAIMVLQAAASATRFTRLLVLCNTERASHFHSTSVSLAQYQITVLSERYKPASCVLLVEVVCSLWFLSSLVQIVYCCDVHWHNRLQYVLSDSAVCFRDMVVLSESEDYLLFFSRRVLNWNLSEFVWRLAPLSFPFSSQWKVTVIKRLADS